MNLKRILKKFLVCYIYDTFQCISPVKYIDLRQFSLKGSLQYAIAVSVVKISGAPISFVEMGPP